MDASLFFLHMPVVRQVGQGFFMKGLKGKTDSANTVFMGIKQRIEFK
jgi:hypothetical protein